MLDAGDGIIKPTNTITKIPSLAVLYKLAQYPFLILFVVFVPRRMGPEFYGQYALLISIVVITTSLLTLASQKSVVDLSPSSVFPVKDNCWLDSRHKPSALKS
jgi:hypothetical protein